MSHQASAPRISLRTALAMVTFTLVFTTLMAGTYQLTHERIAQSAAAEKLLLIDQILPRSAYDNDLLSDVLYVPANPALGLPEGGHVWRARHGGTPAALVVEAAAPDGYGGAIRLIVAVSADGRISGVRVTEHRETPGLGDYIDPRKDKGRGKPWIEQFSERPVTADAASWQVRKDGGDFDYHTGATISARAVSGAVGRVAAYVRDNRDPLFAAAN